LFFQSNSAGLLNLSYLTNVPSVPSYCSDEQLSGGCCRCPQLWAVGIAACRRRQHGHPAGIPLHQLTWPHHRHVQLGGRRQCGLCAGHQSAAVRLPHRRQPRPVELQPGELSFWSCGKQNQVPESPRSLDLGLELESKPAIRNTHMRRKCRVWRFDPESFTHTLTHTHTH